MSGQHPPVVTLASLFGAGGGQGFKTFSEDTINDATREVHRQVIRELVARDKRAFSPATGGPKPAHTCCDAAGTACPDRLENSMKLGQYLGYGAGDAANNLTFSMVSALLLIYHAPGKPG